MTTSLTTTLHQTEDELRITAKKDISAWFSSSRFMPALTKRDPKQLSPVHSSNSQSIV